MASYDEEILAIEETIVIWQERADGKDNYKNCPLCYVADDYCQVCPYYLEYGECTLFKGYDMFFHPQKETDMKEGAKLIVTQLWKLLHEWRRLYGPTQEATTDDGTTD